MFIAGVVGTDDKLFSVVNDTGKFTVISGVVDTGDKFITGVNVTVSLEPP